MADEHKRIAPAAELPAADADFESYSDEELEAANKALQAARSELGDRQDALVLVRNKRTNEAQAAAKLEGLDPTALNVLIEAAAAKLSASAEAPAEEDAE